MRVRAACTALVAASGCFDDGGLVASNGIRLAEGIARSLVTTLSGECVMESGTGSIECDGLIVRLNQLGVSDGIGYEQLEPSAPACAGESGAAPRALGVFSFGSLHIAPGSRVRIRSGVGLHPTEGGGHAIALVAAHSIEIAGKVEIDNDVGGFPAYEDVRYSGPSPGAVILGGTGGASGGGAGTEGGSGGNGGAPRTTALPPQFEPLCGGSGGGHVGEHCGGTRCFYGVGGDGGGAAVLATSEHIVIDGPPGCGIYANGRAATGSSKLGGGGGGAGGTISLESPSVTIGADCRVIAVGGGGGGGQCSAPSPANSYCSGSPGQSWDLAHPIPEGGLGGPPDGGNGGAGGYRDAPAEDGGDGGHGGGGGGSAGFVRLRTSSCDPIPANTSPAATCERL